MTGEVVIEVEGVMGRVVTGASPELAEGACPELAEWVKVIL